MAKAPIKFIIARLKERSSWIGVFAFLATFGLLGELSPEQQEQIVQAGVAIASALLVFLPDSGAS